MRKIIALLQARADSTRLPNKVLKNILNQPMIIHQLQRVSKSKLIDKLIVVTSNEKTDDKLVKILIKNNFNIYRFWTCNLFAYKWLCYTKPRE